MGSGVSSVTVVVADDNALLREGIASLLEDAGHEVVGRSPDADDLMLKVRSYTPDVAIVDVRMPPGNADDGLRAAAAGCAGQPAAGFRFVAERGAGEFRRIGALEPL